MTIDGTSGFVYRSHDGVGIGVMVVRGGKFVARDLGNATYAGEVS